VPARSKGSPQEPVVGVGTLLVIGGIARSRCVVARESHLVHFASRTPSCPSSISSAEELPRWRSTGGSSDRGVDGERSGEVLGCRVG
jgi:hypothetical protein